MIDIKKIYKKLGVKKRDKIYLASNILNLIAQYRKKNFDPNLIIDELIDTIGKDGFIAIPTFSWDFCQKKKFDYIKTIPKTGSLGKLSLLRKDFIRSKNPIHSFSLYGKNKIKISKLKHYSSFDKNSPFGYLINNKGKMLLIDIDYKLAMTFVHVAEEECLVNYRYFKIFKGIYKNKNGNSKKYQSKLFARKSNLVRQTLISNKFDQILLKEKILKKINYKGILFTIIDINPMYKLFLDDIKNNKGMIYPDFY